MIFVDVGAHIGEYAVRAAQIVGEQGRVYAFEPNPTCYQVLLQNVIGNHLQNIFPERAALSDCCGQALFEHRKYPDGSGLRRKSMDRTIDGTNPILSSHTVETTTLEHFVQDSGLNRLDLMKIDVEGAELKVVRGSEDILIKFSPTLIFEFDTRLMATYGFDPEEILSRLRVRGYQVCSLRLAGSHLHLDEFCFRGESDLHLNLVAFSETTSTFNALRLNHWPLSQTPCLLHASPSPNLQRFR